MSKIISDILPPQDPNEDPIILEPDFAIKEKIGADVNIRELLSDEILEEAQQVIHRKKGEFIEYIRADVQILMSKMKILEESSWDATLLEEFSRIVLQIKSRAGTFGYPLGSEIARKLYVFCDEGYRAKTDHLIVLRKHVEGLMVIFSQGIEGDGGEIGAELLRSLDKLAAKLA